MKSYWLIFALHLTARLFTEGAEPAQKTLEDFQNMNVGVCFSLRREAHEIGLDQDSQGILE